MKPVIAALFLVRNEEWCLGASLRSATIYADHVVVYNDRSTDGTAAIIEAVAREHPGKVHTVPPLSLDQRVWPEMQMRQATLQFARTLGATHFAINDADEVLTARLLRRMANEPTRQEILHHIRQPGQAIGLSMFSPYRGQWSPVRSDRSFAASCVSWLVHDAPDLCWADDNDRYCHHRRLPRGATHALTIPRAHGGIFHLQFINRRRLVAKAVWYKLQETVSFPGRMPPGALNQKYDWAISEENMQLEPVNPEDLAEPVAWLSRFVDTQADAWQLAEAKRLYAEHGPPRFTDLNLYEPILGPL